MKNLIDFSKWRISNESPYGGGSREKNWIENPITGQKGLFKYPKINPAENKVTGEYWAEDLAVEIANQLNVKCADVNMGIFDGRVGSISYLLTSDNESLIEGVQYITNKYPTYDQDKFIDIKTQTPYSIAMILNSIDGQNFKNEFLKIPVFDCLIGNSDRHSSNWGIITNHSINNIRFSPLYDNGSSLTCYINEKDIPSILKDKNRFEAVADRKSLSIIRWNTDKRITHLQLLDYLKINYYKDINDIMNSVQAVDESKLDIILNKYPSEIISDNRKILIKKFLMYKIDKMKEIYFD